MIKQRLLILFEGSDEYLESILENLKNSYNDEFEIFAVNFFDTDNKKLKHLQKNISNPQLGNVVTFYDKLKDIGGPRFMRFASQLFFGNQIKYIISKIKAYTPDIIISSNYFLVACAIKYKKKFNNSCRVIAYNEELINHKWWDNKNNIYVVSNDNCYYFAIGKGRYSPVKVRIAKQTKPKQYDFPNLSKKECRKELNINDENICILIDDFNKLSFKIIKHLLSIQNKLQVIVLYKSKLNKENILKIFKNHKNNQNLHMVEYKTHDEAKAMCASDIFFTVSSYKNIKKAMYFEKPIFIYNKCSKNDKNINIFIRDIGAGVYSYKINNIERHILNWIKKPQKLITYKDNISKFFNESPNSVELTKIINEEANKPIVNVSKNDYNNMLYELALQERFDAFTTPINITSVKELLSYEQVKKSSIPSKAYKLFAKALIKTFAPIVNFIGFGIKIEGRENLKGIDSGITISNHVHYLDCLWNIQAISKHRKFYITGAPFNFKKGFLGATLKAGGFIPLATSFSQKKEFDNFVSDILAKNGIIHFYSEGSMWFRYEQSRPLKKGAFFYASKNNVPVIPVVICFKKKPLRRKKAVVLKICKPIYPDKNLTPSKNCNIMNLKAQQEYDDAIIEFYHYNKDEYAMNKVQKNKAQN